MRLLRAALLTSTCITLFYAPIVGILGESQWGLGRLLRTARIAGNGTDCTACAREGSVIEIEAVPTHSSDPFDPLSLCDPMTHRRDPSTGRPHELSEWEKARVADIQGQWEHLRNERPTRRLLYAGRVVAEDAQVLSLLRNSSAIGSLGNVAEAMGNASSPDEYRDGIQRFLSGLEEQGLPIASVKRLRKLAVALEDAGTWDKDTHRVTDFFANFEAVAAGDDGRVAGQCLALLLDDPDVQSICLVVMPILAPGIGVLALAVAGFFLGGLFCLCCFCVVVLRISCRRWQYRRH